MTSDRRHVRADVVSGVLAVLIGTFLLIPGSAAARQAPDPAPQPSAPRPDPAPQAEASPPPAGAPTAAPSPAAPAPATPIPPPVEAAPPALPPAPTATPQPAPPSAGTAPAPRRERSQRRRARPEHPAPREPEPARTADPRPADVPAPLRPPATILIERAPPRAQAPAGKDLSVAGLALLLVAFSSGLLLLQAARVRRELGTR